MTDKEEEEEMELQLATVSPKRCDVVNIKKDTSCKKSVLSFPGLGLLLAFLSAVSFSCASLTVKLLPGVHPLSILFGRSICQLCIFLPVCIFKNYNISGIRNERIALWARILFGAMGICGMYYSIRIMPLADASTIVFSSPAFTGIIACLLLKEPCGISDIGTVVFVLIGVVLICKPTFIFGGTSYDYQLEGTLAAVSSALTQALVIICLRKMKKTPSSVIIVVFSIVVSVLCAVVLSFLQSTVVPKCGNEAGLYLACGIFSSFGQFLMTTAAKIEKAGPLSVIRTTDIIMAFLFQVSLLGDIPTWTSILGAIMVCMTVLVLGLKKWYHDKPSFLTCKHLGMKSDRTIRNEDHRLSQCSDFNNTQLLSTFP